jgi:hypothetical protein
MSHRLPGAAQEPAEHRHAQEQAGHQGAHVSRVWVLRENRGLDHRAVPGQDAGVVCHEQSAAGRGHVLDASCLDAPIVAIQQREDREKRLRPLRIEAELVDLVIRPAARELLLFVDELGELHDPVEVDHVSPRQVTQSHRELAQALEGVDRGLALEPPDPLGHPKSRLRPHDLCGLAVLLALLGGDGFLDHRCASSFGALR